MQNRRKSFRVLLANPLCASMTIVMVNQTLVNTGTSKVCIKDIGPGGLRFSSKFKFPVDAHILLSFKLTILNTEMEFLGRIVRSCSIENAVFEYGVKFSTDYFNNIAKDTDYFSILNKLAILQRKVGYLDSCSFCSKESINKCFI